MRFFFCAVALSCLALASPAQEGGAMGGDYNERDGRGGDSEMGGTMAFITSLVGQFPSQSVGNMGDFMKFAGRLLGVDGQGGHDGGDAVSKLAKGILNGMVSYYTKREDGGDWNPEESADKIRSLVSGVLKNVFPDWDESKDQPTQLYGLDWDPEKNAQLFTRLNMEAFDGLFPGWNKGGVGGAMTMDLLKRIRSGRVRGLGGGDVMVRFLTRLVSKDDTVSKITVGILKAMTLYSGEKRLGQRKPANWDAEKSADSIRNTISTIMKAVFPTWDDATSKPVIDGVNWDPEKNSAKFTELSMEVLDGLFPTWLKHSGWGDDDKDESERDQFLTDMLDKVPKGSFGNRDHFLRFAKRLLGVGSHSYGGASTASRISEGILRGMLAYYEKAASGDVEEWSVDETASTIKELVLGTLKKVFPEWDESKNRPKKVYQLDWDPEKNAEIFTKLTMDALDGLFPQWNTGAVGGGITVDLLAKLQSGGDGGNRLFELLGKLLAGDDPVSKLTMGILKGMLPYAQGAGSSAEPWDPEKSADAIRSAMTEAFKSIFPAWDTTRDQPTVFGVDWNPAKRAQAFTELTMEALLGLFPGFVRNSGWGDVDDADDRAKFLADLLDKFPAGSFGNRYKFMKFVETLLGVGSKDAEGGSKAATRLGMGILKGMLAYYEKAKSHEEDWDPEASADRIRTLVNGALRKVFPDWDDSKEQPTELYGLKWDPEKNAEIFTKLNMEAFDGLFPKWNSEGSGGAVSGDLLAKLQSGSVTNGDKLLKFLGRLLAGDDTVSKITTGIMKGMLPYAQGAGSKPKRFDPVKSAQAIQAKVEEIFVGVFPDWDGKRHQPSYGIDWDPAKNAQAFTELTMEALDGLFPSWFEKSEWGKEDEEDKDATKKFLKDILGKVPDGVDQDGKLKVFLKTLLGGDKTGKKDTVASIAMGILKGLVPDGKSTDSREDWDPEENAKDMRDLINEVFEGVFPDWDSVNSRPSGESGIDWNPEKNAEKFTRLTMKALDAIYPGWQGLYSKFGSGLGGGMGGIIKYDPKGNAQTATQVVLGVLEALFPGWKSKFSGGQQAGYGGMKLSPKEGAKTATEITLGVLEALFPNWQSKYGGGQRVGYGGYSKSSYGAYGGKSSWGRYGGIKLDPKEGAKKATEVALGVLEAIFPNWQSKYGGGQISGYGQGKYRMGGKSSREYGGYEIPSLPGIGSDVLDKIFDFSQKTVELFKDFSPLDGDESGGFQGWMKNRGWGTGISSVTGIDVDAMDKIFEFSDKFVKLFQGTDLPMY